MGKERSREKGKPINKTVSVLVILDRANSSRTPKPPLCSRFWERGSKKILEKTGFQLPGNDKTERKGDFPQPSRIQNLFQKNRPQPINLVDGSEVS
jgi:hypothetical protein